ncbi:OLC1v1008857C1 [Oldenlandia corymbosa var. corymbosa]|uniref:OLC1v1008857C1 n=1 Tax=Oldenlandia corymbosa var. corymbosa TaxID=529605 RepID=A0AAV1DQ22_OLDCO|nr:OLC1v1008857C1 [Oldenlandia corymbosa var. corymbosa]
MKTSIFFIVTIFLLGVILKAAMADPTDGFTQVPISQSNFQVQYPYDVSQSDRYSFVNGVHKFWVYSTDKPFSPSSTTKPRTEIRITGYDYSSGTWQFEGNMYIPSGTSGVSVMQVFGGSSAATTAMLRVYNPNLTYYRSPVIISNVYGTWYRVNVIHNADAGRVQVYINGVFKYETGDNGDANHYFKFGVYTQDSPSNYMESRWSGIKVFRK